MNSMYNDGAMESMFDAELTAATLLDSVKANVAKTINTVDAAASLENKLSEEAAQFNACLTTMSNAIRKCERGEISREEMLAECAPCVTALKEKCAALKLADVKATGDDITEAEIAMLKEYIVGCKDIVADRKKELQDCPVDCKGEGATEGVLAALSEYEPATEASLVKEIRKSTEAKTANQLYKQAKKLYGLGSKEQALKYLKDAKKLYEKCLEKAEKNAKQYKVERTVKANGISDKFERKVTDSIGFAYTIQYFEDRIDSCKALELQWNNKAGKSSYKETKAQLKEERKATRKANREAKRAEKAKADEEATEALGMTVEEFVDAMESVMDSYELDLTLEAALEAETDVEGEGSEKGASGLGAKFRKAFSKLKNAKAEGDDASVKEAQKEISKAADELGEAAKDATPEEKKKLSKAAKIGIAAAAAAAAAVGAVAIAKRAGKVAETADKNAERGFEPTKYQNMMKSLSSAIASAKGSAVTAANNLKDSADRAKEHARNKQIAKQFTKSAFGKIKGAKVEESFLGALAFGLEGVCVEGEDVDDDKVEPEEGKAIDVEDIIEEANESELDELATEAAIAVMMAEDGLDDSDLD